MSRQAQRVLLIATPLLLALACASTEDEQSSALPLGGTGGDGTGGSASGTGGSASGTGGSASGTGGSTTAGLGGLPASGGSAAGGTVSYDGDCAGKPTAAEWSTSSAKATGDEVIFRCEKIQSGCVGLELGKDYLFECVATHVPNCDQSPADGSSWEFLVECGELGAGGGGAGSQ